MKNLLAILAILVMTSVATYADAPGNPPYNEINNQSIDTYVYVGLQIPNGFDPPDGGSGVDAADIQLPTVVAGTTRNLTAENNKVTFTLFGDPLKTFTVIATIMVNVAGEATLNNPANPVYITGNWSNLTNVPLVAAPGSYFGKGEVSFGVTSVKADAGTHGRYPFTVNISAVFSDM